MSDDDSEDFHFVMVECRNPRHARGKVAKVISYCRFDDEDEWTCGIMQPGLKRHIRKQRQLHRQGLSDQDVLNKVGPQLEPTVPRCKLCRRGLPDGFDHRSGDTKILNTIAARGADSVSLEELHRLASSRHKG